MTTANQSAANLFPAARWAHWRKWVALLAQVCTTGTYSIELTHDHETLASELGCPSCHPMVHSALTLLKPNLAPVFSQSNWFFHILLAYICGTPTRSFTLRPQTRAPPVSATSQI